VCTVKDFIYLLNTLVSLCLLTVVQRGAHYEDGRPSEYR